MAAKKTTAKRAKGPTPSQAPAAVEPAETKPANPARAREQLLAWWLRTMNELHWVSDKLLFGREPFKDALSPGQCNEMGVLLDEVWHKMAGCLPLTPPAEFRE